MISNRFFFRHKSLSNKTNRCMIMRELRALNKSYKKKKIWTFFLKNFLKIKSYIKNQQKQRRADKVNKKLERKYKNCCNKHFNTEMILLDKQLTKINTN